MQFRIAKMAHSVSDAKSKAGHSRAIAWDVLFLDGKEERRARYEDHELAIDAACELIDKGYEVHGIGRGPLAYPIGKQTITRIYAIWARDRSIARR
jgi:hypothetical protein